MSLFNVFDIAGSGMHAQNVRLNATASNLANADSMSSNDAQTDRAKVPIFQTMIDEMTGDVQGVRVQSIENSQQTIPREYNPVHPMADEQGYIYRPNVNVVEEMANMMSASRSYEMNVEVMTTSKQLMLKTIMLGQ
jgi:flagellar basal-body rod protein FlgC